MSHRGTPRLRRLLPERRSPSTDRGRLRTTSRRCSSPPACQSRSHAGAHDLFYLHFVRTGAIPPHVAKLFAGLQRFREQADYARAFHFDEQDARQEVANARSIVELLGAHLAAGGWLG